MAKFRSEVRTLVLHDGETLWAWFKDHEFETDDNKLAERLRGVEGVSEVKDEKPADAGDTSK